MYIQQGKEKERRKRGKGQRIKKGERERGGKRKIREGTSVLSESGVGEKSTALGHLCVVVDF